MSASAAEIAGQRRRAKEAQAQPKLRGWPRVPIPVLVTVIGVGLSTWLIPAFTRQWDDRQKVGELKATLVAEIASATGRALIDAHLASATPPGDRSLRGTIPGAGREWSVATLRIRARLQAYFGSAAVERWTLISQYVTSTLSLAYGSSEGGRVIPSWNVSRLTSERLATRFRQYWLRGDIVGIEMAILSEQERLTRSIVGMHARGYSTTWRDVVGDLFPYGSEAVMAQP